MPMSYRALCSDFYVNQRLHLKMDLAMRRDNVLAFFDRVRRELPSMDRFRRYRHELALEMTGRERSQNWLALRRASVRSGSVNPESEDEAFKLHRLVLELVPYFLDVSALDIDHVELLFGFDLAASGNHDEIVYRALMSGSPLGALADAGDAVLIDCQPMVGIGLDDGCDFQAHFEVKTRTTTQQVSSGAFREDPISVYLTIRKYGPIADVRGLSQVFDMLVTRGNDLLAGLVVPRVIGPLREQIASGGGGGGGGDERVR